MKRSFAFSMLLLFLIPGINTYSQSHKENHRPQFHFSPKEYWMNDPNGLVYHKGVYHMFYQHYPKSTKWGPMHWGHATSIDLMHWEHQPIALYPDSLGYIFSGSVVVDKNNTSGLGNEGKVPLIALYTYHHPDLAKTNPNNHQYQGLAFSLDDGKTWIKYDKNPVLKNPGIPDFRDPKVNWHEASKKWIMSLAVANKISFYASPDLLNWKWESDFGENLSKGDGVWECPDLFPLELNGKKIWVLIVSINPGGPNGGSATKYYLGDFDGETFTSIDNNIRWLDHGPDNYAGVTFFNTGDRKILIGWMSNWQYGQQVPTEKWRSAMTIPRELFLKTSGGNIYLASKPAIEFESIIQKTKTVNNLVFNRTHDLSSLITDNTGLFDLKLTDLPAQDFFIQLSNTNGEELKIGFDKTKNEYYIDRTKSGKTDFEKGFGKRHTSPRISSAKNINLRIIADVASVELFADDGLNVMTSIFFPGSVFTSIKIVCNEKTKINRLTLSGLSQTLR